MANHTILLIDYEPRSIERFRDPLVGAGYSVELATDGVSGMEAFHRLNPDMVIVEAMIPKKHGFEVCQELKRTPHGRRTPVIITTGVYKGRKYRTQALHIYGCDEYIEKPIAPAQLLEIIGRFLAPGLSSPSAGTAAPMPVSSGSGDRSIARESVDAIARPTSSVDNDEREDEITARLDALLSGRGPETPQLAAPQSTAVAVAVDQDFLAQMRAELDAELDAISSPLPFETAPTLEPILEPLVSDQLESPSVLEALPIPAMEKPAPADVPDASDVMPAQVVNFETKRSRKGKKSSKQAAKPSPAAEAIEAVALPPAVAPPVQVAELAVPRWTMAESELETKPERTGMPKWAWAAMAVVVLVGIYLVYPGGNSSSSVPAPKPTPTPKPPATVVAAATPVTTPPLASVPPPVATPPPTPAPVVASVPSLPPPRAPEPSRPVPQRPKPVVTAAKVAAPSAAPTIAPSPSNPSEVADTMPVAIKRNPPAYSAAAKQLRLSGRVIMNVLVNEQGTVDQVVLVSAAPGAALNDSALAAAKAWTYRPATKNGAPVKVWKSEQVVFMP